MQSHPKLGLRSVCPSKGHSLFTLRARQDGYLDYMSDSASKLCLFSALIAEGIDRVI